VLRVSIILEPYGQTPGTTLGSVTIVNNAKGNKDYGYYDVTFVTGNTTETIHLRRYKRSNGFWPLIRKAIQGLETKNRKRRNNESNPA